MPIVMRTSIWVFLILLECTSIFVPVPDCVFLLFCLNFKIMIRITSPYALCTLPHSQLPFSGIVLTYIFVYVYSFVFQIDKYNILCLYNVNYVCLQDVHLLLNKQLLCSSVERWYIPNFMLISCMWVKSVGLRPHVSLGYFGMLVVILVLLLLK